MNAVDGGKEDQMLESQPAEIQGGRALRFPRLLIVVAASTIDLAAASTASVRRREALWLAYIAFVLVVLALASMPR